MFADLSAGTLTKGLKSTFVMSFAQLFPSRRKIVKIMPLFHHDSCLKELPVRKKARRLTRHFSMLLLLKFRM